MDIAIVGFGLEGKAAYDYWKDKGDITICDVAEIDSQEGIKTQIGSDYLKDLSRFDLIVRSPAVKPESIAKANGGTEILAKVTSNTNEFFKVSPTKNIVGVTGTKGKGTTTTLIAKILEASGKSVHIGGNIGVPALDLLKANITSEDWVVLELSSFQLIDIKYSPHIALCLMVAPEHLNWHSDADEYFEAKSQLFRYQNAMDMAIFYALNANSRQIASSGDGQKIPYYASPGAIIDNNFISIDGQSICEVSELKLRGRHNWQNICAAVTTVWQVDQNIEAIRQVLTSFSGLEHRLEYVSQIDGASYFDDSFGTTPDTAIVAIEAFSEPKIVILGGSDKGASYDNLAQCVVNNNVKKVLLIGEQGPSIGAALARAGFKNTSTGGSNMTEIIKTARSIAQPGDVILLSPGCASFDMFRDYKDRGNQFKQVVRELALSAAQSPAPAE